MHEKIITGLMLIIAVIHLLPLSGFFGVERLVSLYKVEIIDANLEILMRHRAVLFGILGGFFAYSAFNPSLQPLAFLAAFISIASFFFLSFSVGDFNEAIRKVVIADVVASVSLLGAVGVYFLKRNS
ncbi:MAG: hypothetical protein OQJ97_10730 [Rhodospirillales bacterium]|nr:hypothetical protein [Rhodospirillales bacterium]